tara:strand:- start:871 stop:1092 length:222 start_codon:yes stop_codon:yes gene_type:complete
MKEKERSMLNDEQMLFTMLTALVKKNGGEIRITENEMDSVTTKDMVMMYYSKNTNEIILSLSLLNTTVSDEIF